MEREAGSAGSLELKGPGDPSGIGEAFAFVRCIISVTDFTPQKIILYCLRRRPKQSAAKRGHYVNNYSIDEDQNIAISKSDRYVLYIVAWL